MTITLQAVNELIQSLESAGRERKYLELAKAYQQLAAENAALKLKGKELLGEACAVYSKLNKLIDPAIGDFVDGQTLHEFQFVLDAETPATDRIVAGIKADGVEEFAELTDKVADEEEFYDNGESAEYLKYTAKQARLFAKQLREGADK